MCILPVTAEGGVERLPGDAKVTGYLGLGHVLSNPLACQLDRLLCELRSAVIDAVPFGNSDTFSLSLPDGLAFQLSNDGQDCDHEFALRRVSIQGRVVDEFQGHAFGF